jgi:signal transduction histidine kinase
MSKTIVEQAKGQIWFETEEDEGTTFFVELPIFDETLQPPMVHLQDESV